MSAIQVKLVANFKVIDYSRFTSIAKEMVAYCKQNEPDTLIYDWYVDVDKSEGRLVEVYADTEAFRRHVTGEIFTALAPKMLDAIEWQSLEAFGELPREFDRVMKAFPSTRWSTVTAAI